MPMEMVGGLNPLGLELTGYRESDPDPLEEYLVLFTTELSLQPPLPHFFFLSDLAQVFIFCTFVQ